VQVTSRFYRAGKTRAAAERTLADAVFLDSGTGVAVKGEKGRQRPKIL